ATVLGEDGQPALIGPPFRIVGVGDMEGDGQADIVWHHDQTGETQIWFMHEHQLVRRGTVLGEDGNPAFVNLPFEIVGVGDLDGDGRADIVWHHRDTGETQIWFMDGHQLIRRGTVLGEDGNPAFVNLPFEIVGVGEG
ncbi:MAG TPA: VCBS repeat-containing protein, partial [Actinomycetes bacterium]|nr:VCBS repeat-containing protein [Actinomycetes bacterium]